TWSMRRVSTWTRAPVARIARLPVPTGTSATRLRWATRTTSATSAGAPGDTIHAAGSPAMARTCSCPNASDRSSAPVPPRLREREVDRAAVGICVGEVRHHDRVLADRLAHRVVEIGQPLPARRDLHGVDEGAVAEHGRHAIADRVAVREPGASGLLALVAPAG